ncbi:MAG: hypothetical protein Q4B28_07895 [bacterium]|nr:hypothetical protein [bacterium]
MKEKITTLSAAQFLTLLEEKQGNLKATKNLHIRGKVIFGGEYHFPIRLGKIIFSNEVCCGQATFLQGFHCGQARFKSNFRFNQAIFKGNISYGNAVFERGVYYGVSHFDMEIDYADAIFERDIDHEQAHFSVQSVILIGNCTFKGKKICRNRPELANKFLMKEFKIFN